jgi:hypothetical protein
MVLHSSLNSRPRRSRVQRLFGSLQSNEQLSSARFDCTGLLKQFNDSRMVNATIWRSFHKRKAVDAAARIKAPFAAPGKLRNTLPPLASNGRQSKQSKNLQIHAAGGLCRRQEDLSPTQDFIRFPHKHPLSGDGLDGEQALRRSLPKEALLWGRCPTQVEDKTVRVPQIATGD